MPPDCRTSNLITQPGGLNLGGRRASGGGPVVRARGPGMPVVRSPASDRRPGRTFDGRASGGHVGPTS